MLKYHLTRDYRLINNVFLTQLFVQFRARVTKAEVEAILDYKIEPCSMSGKIGENKGIKENPFIKHFLTMTNSYECVEFGEYVDIKRKGHLVSAQATMAVTQTTSKKPKRYNHNDSELEEISDKEVDDESVEIEQEKKKSRIDPTKKNIDTVSEKTLLDSEVFKQQISETNMKESPKATPQKFVTTSDLAGFKNEIKTDFKNEFKDFMRLLKSEMTPKKPPGKIDIKEEKAENTEI
jgi:hypothetical protein